MPAAKLRPVGSENDGTSARHVLAAVVAHPFDHGPGATVADTESFGSASAEEGLAARGTVEHDVADQDVLFRHERAFRGRIDDDASAGESLADIVVGVPTQFQRDAVGQKRPETLAGRTVEFDVDGVVRQALVRPTVSPGCG